jgi:hypothetical protein
MTGRRGERRLWWMWREKLDSESTHLRAPLGATSDEVTMARLLSGLGVCVRARAWCSWTILCWRTRTQAVNALKAKLRKEWEDQQAESRRSSIAKVVIMVIGVIGGLFVCGGPVLFLIRALRVRALAEAPRRTWMHPRHPQEVNTLRQKAAVGKLGVYALRSQRLQCV